MRTQRRFLFALALSAASFLHAQTFVPADPLPGNPRGEPFTFSINGLIYVGSGGYENDFYSFDPANGHWTALGTLPGVTTARGFSVSFVINGKGYVCLGRDGNELKNDLWEYDPPNNHWTQRHAFPGAARMGAFGFAANGKGYVGGGTDLAAFYGDFYSYDPVGDAWSGNLGNIPTGPVVFASAFTWNDEGYLLGGGHANGTDGVQLYRYDAIGNQWVPRASFTGPAREASVCFALNGKVYYGLGQTQFATAFNDLYAYDPSNNEWAPAGTFPGTARGWAGSCSTGTRAFVGLGWDLGTTLFNDWWEFTVPAGIQELRAPLELQVFPSPASDRCTVMLSPQARSIELFDATGSLVHSGTIGEGRSSIALERPASGAGVYLLRVKEQQGTTIAFGRVVFL